MKDELLGKVSSLNLVLHFTLDELTKNLTQLVELNGNVSEMQRYHNLIKKLNEQIDKLDYFIDKQL